MASKSQQLPAKGFFRFQRGGRFGFRCFDKDGNLLCFSGFVTEAARDAAGAAKFLEVEREKFAAPQLPLFPAAVPQADLTKLNDEYRLVLLARGCIEQHADQQHDQICAILTLGSLARCEDITKGKIQLALGELVKPKSAGGRGLGLETANNYLGAFQSFCTHLEGEGYVVRSIRGIKPYNSQTDRRNQGAPFTEDQLTLLLQTAQTGTAFRGIEGADCAMTFFVAAVSGLRAKELRVLRMEKLRLAEPPYGVTAISGVAKNHKEEFIPFAKPVAEFIRLHLGNKLPTALALKVPQRHYESKCVKHFLKLAKIPDRVVETIDGHRVIKNNLTFHSLRRTFVTRLAKNPKLAPKQVQILARHSKIDLTMNVYAQIASEEIVDAVESTPVPIPLWPKTA